MRSFWKTLLIIIPLGGYLLYKKSSNPSGDTKEPSSNTKKEEEIPTAQIIERLTEIDGVTSRVAENLVEKGIYSREALSELSRDELMDIKGIGPKRAEKILNS